jgi:hypothetical protein
MKVIVTKSYYKRSKRGRSPAKFHAVQSGSEVHAKVKLDPVLKRHPDLLRGVLKHENEEIKAWGNGHHAPHLHARSKEPKVTRELGGISGFWREIDRRNKR